MSSRARLWPPVVAGLLSLIWMPTLRRGFVSDDFERVPTTWADFLDDPLPPDGRPLDVLTYALLPHGALEQHAASLLLYIACIGLMWRACRRLAPGPWPTFLALSSFFHPAFLWGVTWIAQRSTLLVIFFLLAAIATTWTPGRLAMIVAASAARAPFLFQNLVFAVHFLRRRQVVASAVSIICFLSFAFAGYVTYYDRAAGGDTLANASIPAAVSLPLRIVKVLEGALYVFAPVPMFTVASWAPVLAFIAYAVGWLIIARSLKRTPTDDELRLPAMAVAMYVPFLFASEVRVTGEAVAMTFLAVANAAAVEWRLSAKVAVIGILVLNLTGIALNYRLFTSEQLDIRGTPVYSDSSAPVNAYRAWREDLRRRVLGLAAPSRTFE